MVDIIFPILEENFREKHSPIPIFLEYGDNFEGIKVHIKKRKEK